MPFVIPSAHNGWGDYTKVDQYKNTILLFIQLRNLSQNSYMGNFSKFSTFSKFTSFYEKPIWLWRANVVIIIDEIVFSQNQIFNKKWNPYVNFFLVLCYTLFVVDVTQELFQALTFTTVFAYKIEFYSQCILVSDTQSATAGKAIKISGLEAR